MFANFHSVQTIFRERKFIHEFCLFLFFTLRIGRKCCTSNFSVRVFFSSLYGKVTCCEHFFSPSVEIFVYSIFFFKIKKKKKNDVVFKLYVHGVYISKYLCLFIELNRKVFVYWLRGRNFSFLFSKRNSLNYSVNYVKHIALLIIKSLKSN